MKIFSLGGDESVYSTDFLPVQLPERMSGAKRNVERLKEGAKRRLSAASTAQTRQIWWTTPSFGRIRAEDRPIFEEKKEECEPKPVQEMPRFTKEESKYNPLYPDIKPRLKKGLAKLDANMERWLEFSNPNYLHEEKTRLGREGGNIADKTVETRAVVPDTERTYILGYTGYVPNCAHLTKSKRERTLDPSLSLQEARHLRNNAAVENTDPEIKKKYEEMPLNKMRITHGISYLPIEANYSRNIHNLPYKEFAM